MPITTKEAAELLIGDKLRTVQRHVSDGKLKLSDTTRFREYARMQGWQLKDDTTQQETTEKTTHDVTEEKPKESTTPSYNPLFPIPDGYVLVPTSTLKQLEDDRDQQREIINKVLNLKVLPSPNVMSETANDATMPRQSRDVDMTGVVTQDRGEANDIDAKIVTNDMTSDMSVPKSNKNRLELIVGACILIVFVSLGVIILLQRGIIHF
jgi:hypothetical protein